MECNYFLSLSPSKMPLKRHGMYLCFIDDNVLLFWKSRSNIKNKRKQNKLDKRYMYSLIIQTYNIICFIPK